MLCYERCYDGWRIRGFMGLLWAALRYLALALWNVKAVDSIKWCLLISLTEPTQNCDWFPLMLFKTSFLDSFTKTVIDLMLFELFQYFEIRVFCRLILGFYDSFKGSSGMTFYKNASKKDCRPFLLLICLYNSFSLYIF